MKPERSNLYLRSNVYWRAPETRLVEDRTFARLVRGRAAVSKLLKMFGIPVESQRHYNAHIQNLQRKGTVTWAQVSTLETHIQCGECFVIPSGITFRGGRDFRCRNTPKCAGPGPKVPILPKQEAAQERPFVRKRTSVRRRLRVPFALAKGISGRRLDVDLAWAIENCRGKVPKVSRGNGDGFGVNVEIDAALMKRYSDDELSAFLVFGITKRKSAAQS